MAAFTFLAYQPVWNGKAIWDDGAHITQPPLRSLHGLIRIWTEPGAVQQYYPLVHSVFWFEHRLWGDSTLGCHLLNILLHSISAFLFLKVLRKLGAPAAWLAAAIFALHPVEVESVAWITELKNTLSGACCLAAALAYLDFDTTRGSKCYLAAIIFFILGLFSKTVIATLPAALLVIFWWKRGRLRWREDILPTIPFFALSMASAAMTIWVEHRFIIGTETRAFALSFAQRCLIAGRAFWFYLGKLFWPVNLAFMYPRWRVDAAVWPQYLFPAAALLLLVLLWWLSRRNRGPLAAMLFFAGTLFPALGFFNVYPFRYSFVADHFQYLPSLGVIALFSAGADRALGRRSWVLGRSSGAARREPRPAGVVASVILCGVLACLTWRQCGMYADLRTLWTTSLAHNPNSALAHDSLGWILLQDGQADAALAHFQKALGIEADDPVTRNNLGLALLQKGRVNEAVAEFQKAVALDPGYAGGRNNLGMALVRKGRVEEGIAQFSKAIELAPNEAEPHNGLGNALLGLGRGDEAIAQFLIAMRLQPEDFKPLNNLGLAFMQSGRLDDAITAFNKALMIQPRDAGAHNNLGLAYARKGQVDEAVAQYEMALELRPGFAEPCLNLQYLAWVLATCPEASVRNGAKALKLAEETNRLSGGQDPIFLRTLAAARAETGHIAEAIAAAKRALSLAASQNNAELAEALKSQISAYEAGSPFRDAANPRGRP